MRRRHLSLITTLMVSLGCGQDATEDLASEAVSSDTSGGEPTASGDLDDGSTGSSGAAEPTTTTTTTGGDEPAPVEPACEVVTCEGDECDAFTPNAEIVKAAGGGPEAPKVVRPPVPVLARQVRLGEDGQYIRPVVPAFRTSADGRVALLRGDLVALRLEKLEAKPLLHQPPKLSGQLFGPGLPTGDIVHPSVKQNFTVKGSSQAFLCQRKLAQPEACPNFPAQDCYDFDLVATVDVSAGNNGVVLESIPVRVRVENPKTVDAEVVAVDVAPHSEWKVTGSIPVTLMAEMVASADGHVVAGRVLSVQDEGEEEPGIEAEYRLNGGGTHKAKFSLFYAYADDPCDVTQWMKRNGAGVFESMRPVPAAAYDERMKSRGYGLAAQPLRAMNGDVLGEKDVLAGSYPWLDREANNLFFSYTNPMPIDGSASYARYPISREGGAVKSVGSSPRGFSVIGSWTQGKHVLLDGIINNEDYGFAADDTHRVSLYSSPDGPLAVRANAGGKNGADQLGLKNVKNNNHHLESLENNLGMHTRSLPVTPRDVVWNVNRGLASDEIVFDDFLDPHVVLFAEMTAAAEGIVTCAVDYTDDVGVGRNRLPAQTTWLRDPILHEGTPLLVHDQPRVDTRGVTFCRTCHVDAAETGERPPTLTLDALVAAPDSVDTASDPRTQPMQPPSFGDGAAMARGAIPADWITGSDGQARPTNPAKGPVPILRYILR